MVLTMRLQPCGSAFNAVAKSVCNSVIPSAPMPCKTFCFVRFYRPALCRACVFILWTSCLLTNKQIKLNWIIIIHEHYKQKGGVQLWGMLRTILPQSDFNHSQPYIAFSWLSKMWKSKVNLHLKYKCETTKSAILSNAGNTQPLWESNAWWYMYHMPRWPNG